MRSDVSVVIINELSVYIIIVRIVDMSNPIYHCSPLAVIAGVI